VIAAEALGRGSSPLDVPENALTAATTTAATTVTSTPVTITNACGRLRGDKGVSIWAVSFHVGTAPG
jgi:hypothetical protein